MDEAFRDGSQLIFDKLSSSCGITSLLNLEVKVSFMAKFPY